MARSAPLALLLVALPAAAQINNTAIECQSVPTYFPRGDHWAMNPNEVVYFQQYWEGSDDLSSNADLAAVDRAFATWMNHQCSGAVYPNILVQDGFDTYGGDYNARNRGDSYDQAGNLTGARHIIYWIESLSGWSATGADSLTVALTTNVYTPDTGFIVTADMEMNGVNFHWRARPAPGSTSQGCSGGTSCFDVESVALHEAGHFLGLNHVECADAVMFPQGAGTSERTALSIHEETAICKLYPPKPASPPTARWTGERCSANSDCPAGLCITPVGLEGTSWGWCSESCACTDGCSDNCPQAFTCAIQQGGDLRFCKPGVHLTGGATTGGCACDVSAGCSSGCACDPDCLTCATNADCSGGLVCANGDCTTCSSSTQCSGGSVCGTDGRCAACTSSSQCAGGQICGSGGACVDCSSSAQCSGGQVCSAGRCGNCTGNAQCSASLVCAAGRCSACTSSSQCAAGQVCDGGLCAACSSSSQCGERICSGGACVSCSSSADCGGRVCSGGLCTECTSAADCGGRVCDGGLCTDCSGLCAGGQVCVGGVCTSCSSTTQCPSGLVCVSGACVSCTSSSQCGAGRVCAAGRCGACASDSDCGAQLCVDGACVDCSDSAQCQSGVCSGGSCVGCSSSAECSGGEVCQSGACGPCTSSSQCTAGQVCEGGLCRACTSAGQCAGGLACIGGSCAACGADAQCLVGELCQSGRCVAAPESGTGAAVDYCAPCTAGSDCSSGMCVGDGAGGSICTSGCFGATLPDGSPAPSCPPGFDCVPLTGGGQVCWPSDPSLCAERETRATLNELCFAANSSSSSDDWYSPCGPGLLCVSFRQRCEGQEGACVLYCSESLPCPDANQTCCFGVGASGACLAADPAAGRVHGGCFDLRSEGELCVAAEESVCEVGQGCFHFGDPSQARCYATCESDTCSPGASCQSFSDACASQFALCCDNDEWPAACAPGGSLEVKLGTGMRCSADAECDTARCATYQGESACVRACNSMMGFGCPGEAYDIDGDGAADGGFACITDPSGDFCWPRQGPLGPERSPEPQPVPPTPVDPPEGICGAAAGGQLAALLAVLALCRRRRC